jgi:hypothetical protein
LIWRVSNDHGHQTPTCAYRAANGRKCAVGYWIPDKLYRSTFEGRAFANANAVQAAMPEELRSQEAFSLLISLQHAHDNANHNGESWRDPWGPNGIANRLYDVVSEFNLNSRVLTECWPK